MVMFVPVVMVTPLHCVSNHVAFQSCVACPPWPKTMTASVALGLHAGQPMSTRACPDGSRRKAR